MDQSKYEQALKIVKRDGAGYPLALQRELHIGYGAAIGLLQELHANGIVDKPGTDFKWICGHARGYEMSEKLLDELVDRFLAWPLPDSVCADKCACIQNYPHRSGTTLLSATEARQMIEHLMDHVSISKALR